MYALSSGRFFSPFFLLKSQPSCVGNFRSVIEYKYAFVAFLAIVVVTIVLNRQSFEVTAEGNEMPFHKIHLFCV